MKMRLAYTAIRWQTPNTMNSFFGLLIGFFLAGLLSFAAAWIILGMYESGRRHINSDDHKEIQREILGIAVRAGIVGGIIAVFLTLRH